MMILRRNLKTMTKAVMENNRIHVYSSAEVDDIYGFVGNFKAKIKQHDGEEKEIEHGIVIVATGAVEYEPTEYLLRQRPKNHDTNTSWKKKSPKEISRPKA